MLLYTILLIPLCFILSDTLLVSLGILEVVCVIVASIRAAKGEVFKYPISIPFIQ